MKTKSSNSSGFTLIEVLLASSLLIIVISGIVGAIFYGTESSIISAKRTQATQIAEQGLEAVKNIKDSNYQAFSSLADGAYGLQQNSGQWQLVPNTPDVQNNFTRTVTLSTVNPTTKEVNISVNWQQNLQRTGVFNLVGRLTNWRDINIVVNLSWSNPGLDSAVDFPNIKAGLKVQISGNYAFVVINRGSQNFLVYNITNPASPTLVQTLSLNGNPTNIFIDGSYAYVASSSNTQELQIINITNPAASTLTGSFNNSGNNDARGVYKLGNYVYLAISASTSQLAVINITNPAAPTLSGIVNLGPTNLTGLAYEVTVIPNYAYVSSSSDTQEVKIVNVSNPAAPTLASSINLPGTNNALTISHNNNNLFIGQSNLLYIYDITNPLSPSALGNVSIGNGGIINDIALNIAQSPDVLFLANSGNVAEFQTINISNTSAPVIFGTYNTPTANTYAGVAYSSSLNRAVIVGDPTTQEMLILKPQ
ncbi:hypothetical protein KBC85_01840 [Candidatus Saccharibacteria bacterium]|nr:hypothetical protein [Candidatus Saccharibacteria bacterium]MDQ5885146.1 hypothetical protein [Patescibacteria group bacterium]MDQ5953717.1 hypothetical protein [Patescibacteria group bacterium]MDQ5958678.1 hypothetical protein [Patescibacteria group bacterium]